MKQTQQIFEYSKVYVKLKKGENQKKRLSYLVALYILQ